MLMWDPLDLLLLQLQPVQQRGGAGAGAGGGARGGPPCQYYSASATLIMHSQLGAVR